MARLQRIAVAAAVVGLALAQGGYSARFLGAACVLVWWAVVIVVLARRGTHRPPNAWAVWTVAALAGLALLSALSIGWASDGGAAFVAAVRAALYAGILVLVVVGARGEDSRPWIDGLASGIALVALLALGSRLESGLPGSDAEIAHFLPSAAGRLSYPIGYWNGLAALLAMGVVALAYLAGQARTALARSLATAAIPIEGLAIYYTSSRGGVAAAAVGLVALVALASSRSRTLASLALAGLGVGFLVFLASRRGALLDGLGRPGAGAQGDQMLVATLIVAGVTGLARRALDRPLARLALPRGLGRALAVGAAALAVVAVLAANPSKRFDEFKAPPSGATLGSGFVASHLASGNGSGRWQYWSAARGAYSSEPLRGIGAGGYEAWWNQHGSLATPAKNAHSLFLETLAELGLIGIIFPLAFFALPAIAGIRRLRTAARPDVAALLALLAAGAASAAVDWTFQLPAAFAPVLVAAGLLAGVPGPAAAKGAAGTSGRWRWGGLAAVGFGLAAIWAGALLFASEQRLADSQSAARAGDLSGAAQAAADAGSLEPWAAAPDLQLALVQELGRDIPAARASIAKAIDLAPQDWRLRLVQARLDVRGGDVAAGRRALREARRLNPNAPFFAAGGTQ